MPINFLDTMLRLFSCKLLISICLIFITIILMHDTGDAQSSFKVNITMADYQSDTLIVGYYYGERQLVRDTLYSQDQKNFTWQGNEALNKGVYILLTAPTKNFIQFFVNEPYPRFSIKSNADLSDINYKKSPDNATFNAYVQYISNKKSEMDPINAKLETATEDERIVLFDQLDKLDQEVNSKQIELIKDNPHSFTTKTIKSSLPVNYPDAPDDLEGRDLEIYQYENYKAHYFDHIDLSDTTLLYTPFLDNRINYYLEKLTVQMPDSISTSIDYLLSSMDKDSQMYRYYLSKFYNKYIKSKMVGMDGVVVHIANNYYGKGLAHWVEEEMLTKIMDNASKLEPALIGKIAEDIKVELQDGTPIKISDIDYEYLVVLFWAPDCGHCKKAMPDVIAFEEQFRDHNIKLLSVCTKYTDKVPECWKSVEQKGMQNFINVVDPYGKSRFKKHFDVRATPRIFILDQKREILIKGIGASQLPDVMNDIIERFAEK